MAMEDKIFNEFQGNTIRVGGTCYTFVGETTSSVNTSENEIDGTYASCLECNVDSSSESSSSSSSSFDSSSSSSSSSLDSSSSSNSSSSSSSGGGAPAGLATCNCAGEPNEGKPRVKVTITGITSNNRSGTDGGGDFFELLGDGPGQQCKFYEGVPNLLCPDNYTGGTNTQETWSNAAGDGNPHHLRLYAATTNWVDLRKDHPTTSAAFILRVTLNTGGSATTLTNINTGVTLSPYTGSNLSPIDYNIHSGFFGTLTTNNADPLTVKWERHCGHPDTTTEWRTGC